MNKSNIKSKKTKKSENNNNRELQPWTLLSNQELLVVPKILRVVKEQVKLPNGKVVDDFYQIQLPEYVIVFAQTADGSIVMERQYKHGTRRIVLSVPSGRLESGEQPIAAAKRELLEETGFKGDDKNWRSLGSYVIAGNQGCGKAHLFKAYKVYKIQESNSEDLEETEIELMKPEEVIQAVNQGEVATIGSVATIALALNPQFMKK